MQKLTFQPVPEGSDGIDSIVHPPQTRQTGHRNAATFGAISTKTFLFFESPGPPPRAQDGVWRTLWVDGGDDAPPICT